MSVYEPNSRHLREVLIFCFNMKKSAAEAHRMLSNTYGEAAISERTCRGFNASRTVILTSKVMFCIWWDQLGVVYYELLKSTETITGDRYRRTQLMRLSRALKDKWPQYNERHDKVICSMTMLNSMLRKWSRHTWKRWNGKSYPTRRILQTLVPHLFRSMAHGLADQYFRSYKEVKSWIDSWIASKDDSFFDAGFVRYPKDGRK